MRSMLAAAAIACAGLTALDPAPAVANVVVGNRVFPVTLTFDDPGASDEATLPQFAYQPGHSGQNEYQFQWEYDKTITPTTSFIYDQGWDVLTRQGMKTRTGFENASITGKWQAFTIPRSETVASFGIMRKFGGNAARRTSAATPPVRPRPRSTSARGWAPFRSALYDRSRSPGN